MRRAERIVQTANGAYQRMPREIWWVFTAYILFLVLLPAGSVMGVNVKALTFLPLLAAQLYYLAKERDALQQISFALCIAAYFLGSMVLALCYQSTTTELAASQLKDIVTTFAGCWIIRLLTRNELDRRAFLRMVLYAATMGCVLKGLLFLYSLRTGISVSDLVDGISAAFGVKLMTADLGETSVRLQFVSDNLLPVCIFALMCQRKKLRIGGIRSLFMMVLLLMSSVYTFSRFLWASAALGAVLGWAVSKRDRVHLIYGGAVTALTLALLPLIQVLIAFRFSSALEGESDSVRIEQMASLSDFFQAAPLFGHGLGSYTTATVRSLETPYNYEVQLLALLAQVGLAGMLIFGIVLVNYFRKGFRFQRGGRWYQAALLLMLADFIAAALFNPCLLTSTAAVIYGTILALAAAKDCNVDSQEEQAAGPRPALLAAWPRTAWNTRFMEAE